MIKKFISKVVSIEVRALHVQRFHQLAMLHANQSVAAAILAGAELNHIKAELKKKPNQLGFLSWFEENQEQFGFSLSTKDNYMRLASEMKRQLPDDIAPLLDFAPSELSPEQQRRLMAGLSKKANGATLNELYLDYGVVKKPHGHGLLKNHDKSKKGEATEPSPDLLIQDELFGRFGDVEKIVAAWNTKTKVGKVTEPLWKHMTAAQKKDALAKIETSISQLSDMRNQVREALGVK